MAEMPKKAKATAALVARRIEEVLRIRLDGAEFWDVREYAREKEAEEGSAWHLADGAKPLSDGQLRRYVARVDAMIADSCRASRKKLLRRHLAQRRNLYAKAVSQGDIRAALAVLSDEAKLLGLYAPVKVAPTNPHGDAPYAPLTDEERAAALHRIYAALGAGGGAAHPDEPAGADGQVSCGPGARPERCVDAAGPVAGETLADDMEPSIAPLFPSDGEIPGGGGAGAE
jgi:hypothetical protein